MKSRLLALTMVGVVLVTACGGSGGSDDTIEGQNVVVEMYDNRFQYTEVRIPVGGTVTWVGAGRNPHNAFAANGEWSTEDVFGELEMHEGDEATLTFDESGEYVFYCTFHGNAQGQGMAGTLIVGEG